jgi:PBP1b-binding outer membrane lipoprotein LpoB
MIINLKRLAQVGTILCTLILSGCVSQADIQKSFGQMYNVPTSEVSSSR